MATTAISLSGLNAASQGLAVTANNVANANTDGYRAKRLDLEEQQEGGVQASKLTESQEPTGPGSSNVDYATEMTSLMTQSGAYAANLQVMKTQDQMLGQFMDMKG
ncbi:flagellar basal body rod protein FlgC [Holophaga foetida]|uniref:flagellar basal body rod protein FlgC n=1 Tax=Holophaga foetida TaxID=35839 RepID=UPI0002473331|nr:flagellar basal body protein [Holophaga foetida]